MATAAQKLLEYGIQIADAHDWLLTQTDPAYVVSVFRFGGFTNAMIGEIAGYPGVPYAGADVLAFFALYGVDSSVLDPAPTVVSVTSASATEGLLIEHTITLSSATTALTELALSFSLTGADISDFAAYSLSNGVSLASLAALQVPAGVSQFTFSLTSTNDSQVEENEGYTINVGGAGATGTILDNDNPAPAPGAFSELLPTAIDGFAAVLALNTRTGDLSNETLRGKVLDAIADDAKYYALFDPAKYDGSDGGVFTAEELGRASLGDLPATWQTIESLYYGTFIDVSTRIDFAEAGVIGTFFIQNIVGIFQHDVPVTSAYVALFVDAAADPVGSGGQLHTEPALANSMPIGIVSATTNPGLLENIFWGLLNI